MEKEGVRHKISRRDFLKLGSLAGLTLAASGLPETVLASAEEKKDAGNIHWKKGDDILLRMQDDLARALTKPREQRKWAMVIDLRKCTGCFACTVACKAENVLPPNVVYRRVLDLESGRYPNPKRDFVPVLCNHCEDAPCVTACPVKATTKRQDGIVDVDYEKCIGCRACLNACAYGARSFDFGQFYTDRTPQLQNYETRPTYEYKKDWPRIKGKSPIGNARKCHFCIHRIERGMLPACVATCIGKATYFGDKEDNLSLVGELMNREKVKRLKESLGTNPRIYYIGLEEVQV
ncbi:MAG TPA: 4Fe-4S dicluster domain-containing protein [Candidatus Omnitrophota bacterium]|nr:4Fe-4S dicluster domain-containing protein [Candidatus Omnitrophota bacterium]